MSPDKSIYVQPSLVNVTSFRAPSVKGGSLSKILPKREFRTSCDRMSHPPPAAC